jgi:electron-transferring-flavoprotein dehydrogenase
MSDVNREVLEVDVLFVGAGPASLAGAIRLAQLAKAHDAAVESAGTGRKLGEVSIAVIEKASEIGMHSLSGAVMDPRALRELAPDFESQGLPHRAARRHRSRVLPSPRPASFKFPITPPPLQNHGKLDRVAAQGDALDGEKAEALGVTTFSPASRVRPCCTTAIASSACAPVTAASTSRASRRATSNPAIDIHAKVTVLGEGPRGSLSKHLIPKLGLDRDSLPQIYATGVKELWRLPAGSLREAA